MQRGIARVLTLVALLASMAGCAGFRGVTETLTSSGPVTAAAPTVAPVARDGKCTVAPSRWDQYGLFQVAYSCAWYQADRVARGDTPLDDPSVQKAYKVMLREGLGLVRGNCNDFFRVRGDHQQNVNLSRDVVALGGATAAAIIGVAGGSALALSIIAVSSAALYGGLDTYTKNFLFGVDNIESVRTLTMNALRENADLVTTKSIGEPLDFQNVAGAIMDNQELCKPASIAANVRDAIKNGRPGINAITASDSGALGDRAVAARISELVGLPTGVIVGEKQLAALCWATTSDGYINNLATVKDVLSPLDSFRTGPGNPGAWVGGGNSVRVASECGKLSSGLQAAITRQIEAFKAAPAGAAAATPVVPSAVKALSGGSSPAASGPGFVPMTVK